MEGAAYYLTLLLAGKLVEVYRIARNAYRKVGVCRGVVIRFNKGLPVQYINIDMVRFFGKIAVQYRYQILNAFFAGSAESLGGY